MSALQEANKIENPFSETIGENEEDLKVAEGQTH